MVFPYSASTSATSGTDETNNTRGGARSSTHHVDSALSSNAVPGSAVSWSAIFAGAAAASALSLILLLLGTGLGLSSVSPWANTGMGATAFGVSTILWVTCAQLIASGMGGYLAGRLRTKYISVHNDEVYFRDTAHGFLTWAVATLVTASLLASAVGTVIGAGASVAGGVGSTAAMTLATAGGAAGSAAAVTNSSANSPGNSSAVDPMNYMLDSMFRRPAGVAVAAADGGAAGGAGSATNTSSAEISRILMNSIKQGALPPDDATYVAAAVSARTGLTPAEAEARVQATFNRMQSKLRDAEASARQAADTTRKATAYGALWLFISMLIGAFFASWGATFGGRHRDI